MDMGGVAAVHDRDDRDQADEAGGMDPRGAARVGPLRRVLHADRARLPGRAPAPPPGRGPAGMPRVPRGPAPTSRAPRPAAVAPGLPRGVWRPSSRAGSVDPAPSAEAAPSGRRPRRMVPPT